MMKPLHRESGLPQIAIDREWGSRGSVLSHFYSKAKASSIKAEIPPHVSRANSFNIAGVLYRFMLDIKITEFWNKGRPYHDILVIGC